MCTSKAKWLLKSMEAREEIWKNMMVLTKITFLGCGFKSLGLRVLSLMGAAGTKRKLWVTNRMNERQATNLTGIPSIECFTGFKI